MVNIISCWPSNLSFFFVWSGMLSVLLTSNWRPRTRECFAIWAQSSFSSCWTACWSRIASPRLSIPTTSREPYCGKQVGGGSRQAASVNQGWAVWIFNCVRLLQVSKASRSPTCWSRRPAVWRVGCAFCSACTQTRADGTPGRRSRDDCSSEERTLGGGTSSSAELLQF